MHPTPDDSISSVAPAIFATCGMKIDLSGRRQPDTITVTHEVEEAVRHFSFLRHEQREFDVKIVVGSSKIYAHKALLTARIPYMRRLFGMDGIESSSGEIDLSASFNDASILGPLISYAYTGTISISEAIVPLLLLSANYLEMLPLVTECSVFIHNRLDINNVIPLLDFFRSISYDKMDEEVYTFIDANIVPLSLTSRFLNLSLNDLLNILSRDTLHVDDESQIFTAITRWINNNPDMAHHGPDLLKCVRCPLLSISFLTQIVEKTEWVMKNEECKELVHIAKDHNGMSENRMETIPFSAVARKCEEVPRLIVWFDRYGEEGTDIHVYNPIRNEWTKRHVSKRPLDVGNAVVIGKKVYFVCYPEEGDYQQVYDTSTDEWQQEGYNRGLDYYPALQTMNERIYVAGGVNDEDDILSTVASIDPSADSPEWTILPPLSKARVAPDSCVFNGKLYVFGGAEDVLASRIFRSGEVFDPATERWTPIAKKNLRRYGCLAAAYKGKIYAVGGHWYRGPNLTWHEYDDVEAYDPSTDSWKIMNRMKTRADDHLHHLVVSCGKLLAVDGLRDCDEEGVRSIMIYREDEDAWHKITTMPKRLNEEKCPMVVALPTPATFGCPMAHLEQVSIESNGFRHFQLKTGLLQAIVEARFLHPTQVQHECLTQSLLGMDVITQSKTGSGKTAGAVISTLGLLERIDGRVTALVLVHSREAAAYMNIQFKRFASYLLPSIEMAVFCGSDSASKNANLLKYSTPDVVICTPGRLQNLFDNGALDVNDVKLVVIDDCDDVITDAATRDAFLKMLTSMARKPIMIVLSSNQTKMFRREAKRLIKEGSH